MEDDCEVEILSHVTKKWKVPWKKGYLCLTEQSVLLKDVRSIYDKLLAGSITAEEVSKSNVLRLI